MPGESRSDAAQGHYRCITQAALRPPNLSIALMKLAWDQYALDAATPQPRVPEFRTRSDTCMESDSGKRAKECGVRDRRYSVRHPFAADARLATQVNSVWQEHNQGLYC